MVCTTNISPITVMAVVDVVEHSKADILEIRTTPKMMKNEGLELYIQSFVQGLSEAKNSFPTIFA